MAFYPGRNLLCPFVNAVAYNWVAVPVGCVAIPAATQARQLPERCAGAPFFPQIPQLPRRGAGSPQWPPQNQQLPNWRGGAIWLPQLPRFAPNPAREQRQENLAPAVQHHVPHQRREYAVLPQHPNPAPAARQRATHRRGEHAVPPQPQNPARQRHVHVVPPQQPNQRPAAQNDAEQARPARSTLHNILTDAPGDPWHLNWDISLEPSTLRIEPYMMSTFAQSAVIPPCCEVIITPRSGNADIQRLFHNWGPIHLFAEIDQRPVLTVQRVLDSIYFYFQEPLQDEEMAAIMRPNENFLAQFEERTRNLRGERPRRVDILPNRNFTRLQSSGRLQGTLYVQIPLGN